MVRRAGGYATLSEDGKVIDERDTLNCCHCGFVMRVKPGPAGHYVLNKCTCCDDYVCEKIECRSRCLPLERRLAQMEFRARLGQWT